MVCHEVAHLGERLLIESIRQRSGLRTVRATTLTGHPFFAPSELHRQHSSPGSLRRCLLEYERTPILVRLHHRRVPSPVRSLLQE
jgi:hypothetical protein